MLLSERVLANPHICGLEVDFSALALAAGNFNLQPFYNTDLSDGNFQAVYSSVGSVSFSEQSNETDSGISYTQNLTIKLPSMDENRSQRLEALRRVRFINLKLSNGTNLLFGRNDFFQNIRPKINVSSNQKVTQVQFTTQSMFPLGFFGNTAPYGFVYQTPISFLENL
jgi:hypothetical protein